MPSMKNSTTLSPAGHSGPRPGRHSSTAIGIWIMPSSSMSTATPPCTFTIAAFPSRNCPASTGWANTASACTVTTMRIRTSGTGRGGTATRWGEISSMPRRYPAGPPPVAVPWSRPGATPAVPPARPVHRPVYGPAPRGPGHAGAGQAAGRPRWQHGAVIDNPAPNQRGAAALVDEFAAGYPFELDDFQRQGCFALAAGRSTLVAAPTGAGKTVVGEFAVWLALRAGGKGFYTTPLKALSHQKFGDFVARHHARNVGLLTGDNSINGEAPVVVMTTEVLRNMLYEG